MPHGLGLIWGEKPCVAKAVANEWPKNASDRIRLRFAKTKEKDMTKPMTKTQLVAAIADVMGADKKTAGAALDAIADVVTREVVAGGSVTIPGLGKVACKARPERQVRNPATGETMTKAADKQVKFAIAKSLKDSVNA